MADKFSVIYDSVTNEPFGIIRKSETADIAYSVQRSAGPWAISYNAGKKELPYGMSASDFIEMDDEFTSSFQGAFTGMGRVNRRAEVLIAGGSKYEPQEIIYGVENAANAKRHHGVRRSILPVIGYAQKNAFRAMLIDEGIRSGRKWLKTEKD